MTEIELAQFRDCQRPREIARADHVEGRPDKIREKGKGMRYGDAIELAVRLRKKYGTASTAFHISNGNPMFVDHDIPRGPPAGGGRRDSVSNKS